MIYRHYAPNYDTTKQQSFNEMVVHHYSQLFTFKFIVIGHNMKNVDQLN